MKWDSESGKLVKEYTGDTSSIRCVALSRDGKWAVTCGFEREARVWDLLSGRQVGSYAEGPGVFKAAVVLPAGKQFAAASSDGSVRLIDLATFKLVRRMDAGHAGGALAVAASKDGKHVVSGGMDGEVRLHDAATGKLIREIKAHAGEAHAVAFSPDGRRLISGGADGAAVVWDAGTGRQIQRLAGHTGLVTSAAFLPGGRQAVTGGYDRTLRLWNVWR
jgi:WD40 repeat protein